MIVIAQDERVVKDWKYAEINIGNTKLEKTLTVTDKRIIVSEESENKVSRNEIAINQVVGLNTHFDTQKEDKKKNGIILLICGLIFAVLIFAISLATEIYFMLAALVISLIMIIIAINWLSYKKGYGQLKVAFLTVIPSSSMMYNLSAAVLPGTTPEQKTQEIIFQVNLTVAREIVDTLGAVILGK